MPGKTGVIKVNYDTHRIGAFTKTVTVESNAKNSPETLKIHGTVLDPNAGATSGQVAKPAQPVTPVPAVAPAVEKNTNVAPAAKQAPAKKGSSK